MNITTTRFGEIEVAPERILNFPTGIPGFPDLRDVAVIPASETEQFASLEGVENLFYLQSIEDADLAFLCMDPFAAFSAYEIEIDEAAHELSDPTEALVLSIMTVPQDESGSVTVNLRAPIIANTRTRVAAQVVLDDARWSVTQPLGN